MLALLYFLKNAFGLARVLFVFQALEQFVSHNDVFLNALKKNITPVHYSTPNAPLLKEFHRVDYAVSVLVKTLHYLRDDV